MTVGFPKGDNENIEKYPYSQPQSFHNLISETTYHIFCSVLLLESESSNPAHCLGNTSHEDKCEELWPLAAVFKDASIYVADFYY